MVLQTVFSEILMFALNRLFGEDKEENQVCCVFAFDAYHYPNAYLGATSA